MVEIEKSSMATHEMVIDAVNSDMYFGGFKTA